MGESVHHNSCINQLAYQFILEQVKEGNCKLVLPEMKMEHSLLYNRYIKRGDVQLKGSEKPAFIAFLENLKEYNSGKDEKEKVTLLGIDYNNYSSGEDGSCLDIFQYITSVSETSPHKILDLFALSLLDKERAHTFSFIQENKEALERALSVEEYKFIAHILQVSDQAGKDNTQRLYLRDSIMYINTQFAIQHFNPGNSSTIIYAHSSHLDPVSAYPAIPCKPLGSYLKDDYSDQYASLLLLIGEGSVWIDEPASGLTRHELSSPVEGCLEYLLNSASENITYTPITPAFDRLMLVRHLGTYKYPFEFFPINVYQRHDGILYIKECPDDTVYENPYADAIKEYSKDQSDINKMQALMEEMEKYSEKKMKEIQTKRSNKEKQIKEIKQRIAEDRY